MDAERITTYRKEFPITEKFIYLDHAGVAPLSNRVRMAVEQVLREATERGAFHYPRWSRRIAEIRSSCARLVNAGPEELAFVKNTSHGLSLVAGDSNGRQEITYCIARMTFHQISIRGRILPRRESKQDWYRRAGDGS